MNKVLIILYLISTIFCADTCSTKTETDCKADSTCKWTPSSCSGDSGNVCSELTEEEACEEEEYDGTQTTCTFSQTTPGACGGTRTGCTGDADACNAMPGCTHDGSSCGPVACSTLSESVCGSATGCTYTAASGTCSGDEGSVCSAHNSDGGACVAQTYTPKLKCSWSSGSCTSIESNSNKSGAGFIMFKLGIFVVFTLMF